MFKKLVLVCLTALLVGFVVQWKGSATPVYITWNGLEPDKWASLWLIQRVISPGSKVEIRPIHSRVDDGVAFDVPGTHFYRDATTSTYTKLLQNYSNDVSDVDPALIQLGKIMRDMDVNVWADKALPETSKLEGALRSLQHQYDRDQVPPVCYLALFDHVYESIKKGDTLNDAELNSVVASCESIKPSESIVRNQAIVQEVPVTEILKAIDSGQKVVFVDTREPEEFSEMHIPGALNIPLRDVDSDVANELKDADLVISYCVKDFRGYEVARTFKELGVEASSIMQPYGIRGWTDLGLPTTVDGKVAEADAKSRLKQCAQNPEPCMRG